MLKKLQNNTETTHFDVIVGSDSELAGNVVSKGSIRIDGSVSGDIISEGNVIIGNDAKVTGNIKGANIEISGHTIGDVQSTGLLKIFETGILDGDIEVMSFIIEEGGAFRGNCDINTSGLAAKPLKEKENDDKPNDNNNGKKNRRNQHNNDNEKTA